MNLRLASGSVTPGEADEEQLLGVHMDQRDVVAVAEQADDLLGLARRASGRGRRTRRSAGRRSPRGSAPPRPRCRPRPTGRRSPCPCRPGRGSRRSWSSRNSAIVQSPAQAADVAHEIGEQLAAVGRVDHLGVEHHRIEAALLVGGDREGRAFGLGDDRGSPRASCSTWSPWLIHTWWRLADRPQAVEQRACRRRSR